MFEISGADHSFARADRLARRSAPGPAAPTRPGDDRRDRVELSAARSAADETPGPDGIRHGLVQRVRSEIADGSYETDWRIAVAADRLSKSVNPDVDLKG